MLTAQTFLTCCHSGKYRSSAGWQTMKSGENDHVVITLRDDISNQLLEAKKEETSSSPSSVELWITSLKDVNELTDDARSDQDNNDVSSDLDDLQLGAEAVSLSKRKKRHRDHRNGGSSRDSDSEDNRHQSRRKRGAFFMPRTFSYERSLDSDTSSLTSCSVSSLLTARESDPEEVLKGLGFSGPSVFDHIPDRFINAGTACMGIDAGQFLAIVQEDSVDPNGSTDFPPWVMARADDIPKQFFRSNSLPCSMSFGSAQSYSANKESTALPGEANKEPSSANQSRPSKTLPFPSKFGTYLEPVSEEVELSSQGSITLSPITNKNLSFESNRSSTLKSNSHDEPVEGIMKIPSLKDLWSSQTVVSEAGSEEGAENSARLTDDVVETSPVLDSLRDCDENKKPESFPAIVGNERGIPEGDESVPALLDYLVDKEQPVSSHDTLPSFTIGSDTEDDDDSSALHLENKYAELGKVCVNEPSEPIRAESKPHMTTIPIVTVSEPEPDEARCRKISTVEIPDSRKLLPFVLEESSSEPPQDDGKNLNSKTRTSRANVKLGCNGRERSRNIRQFSLCGKNSLWVKMERTSQLQVHFSNKISVINSGRSPGSRKITVAKNSRFPMQIVLPKRPCQNIESFVDVDVRCARRRKMFQTISSAAVSGSFSEDSSGFVSLATQSNSSTPDNQSDRNNNSLSKQMGHTQCGGQKTAGNPGKTDCAGKCCDVWRMDSEKVMANETSVEEELDELQSSLKGVKMYKAGIHLMQLASSVETVITAESRPNRSRLKSSEKLLESIQNELKHLEGYILGLQNQLIGLRQNSVKKRESTHEESQRGGSDFSDVTKQLLSEQLRLFSSLSSSVSPSSASATDHHHEDSLPSSSTDDSVFQDDIRQLKEEIRLLRQENENRQLTVKNEILNEVRTEIRNCFEEFLAKKPS